MHSPQKSRSINEDQFLTPQKRVSGKTLRWPSTNKKSLNRKRTKVVIINNIDEDIAGFFARSPLFPPRDPMDLVPDPADPWAKPEMNPNLFRYTPAKSQYKLPNPQEFEDLSLKIEKSISSALNLISRHKTSPRKENIIVPNDKVGISIYDTTNNMSNAVQNLSEASQNLHQLAKSISKLTKSYKVKKQMSVSELT